MHALSHHASRTRSTGLHCHTEPLEGRVLLASVPAGFTDSEIISGMQSPTAMDIAPDGRIFVAGQEGKLYIVHNGQLLNPLTIPNVKSGGERGFVGIVLDPNFASNGRVYVYYTRIVSESGRQNRVARYTFNGNSVVGGETVIFDLPDTRGSTIHMGGALHFGPDGKLYIAVGDHLQNIEAQHLDSAFGKILRINPDGSIPTDNPFYSQTSGIFRAIWARGFRNPFTFNFQSGSGRIFINDVGQDFWEEVNEGVAGGNYGWPHSEGPDNTSGFTAPIYYYQNLSTQCAITGAVFYDANAFPAEYRGEYFFADLCGGNVRVLDTSTFQPRNFATGLSLPVDLDVGPDGALYYLNRGTDINFGHIGKISFPGGGVGAPAIAQQPQSATVARGGTATFTVVATGTGPISYQWRKDNQNIAGATAASLTINNVQPSNAGSYRVVVSNSAGTISSSAANLTVTSGGSPTATISVPATFRAGQTLSFTGSATDPEDGTLAANRFSWRIDYHTGSVIRPFVPEMSGITSGTFTIPTETAYTAPDVFYRVRLTVTDSAGNQSTVTSDIQPLTARIALQSNIEGQRLFLDGQPQDTPAETTGVVGVKRLLSAPATVRVGDLAYAFDRWSDGGDREHYILTPDGNQTYAADYRPVSLKSTKGFAVTITNNRDRSGTVRTGNVPVLDFDWGSGSPDPLIHRDTFFARFRAYVQPEFSETYTFYAEADDAVRLYVDGQLLIDQWNTSNGSELSASLELEAGRKYDLRFDYFENTGNAKARLSWSSPSTPKQIIPRNKLFSAPMPQTLVPTDDAFVQGGPSAGTNFGGEKQLLAKSGAARLTRETYLKFDIADIDSSAISSAKLRFFGGLSSEADVLVEAGIYPADDTNWSERTITFANRPTAEDSPIAHAAVSTAQPQWWEFDITPFLREQRELGRSVITFVLKNSLPSQALTIFSSRNALTDLPQLQVYS